MGRFWVPTFAPEINLHFQHGSLLYDAKHAGLFHTRPAFWCGTPYSEHARRALTARNVVHRCVCTRVYVALWDCCVINVALLYGYCCGESHECMEPDSHTSAQQSTHQSAGLRAYMRRCTYLFM